MHKWTKSSRYYSRKEKPLDKKLYKTVSKSFKMLLKNTSYSQEHSKTFKYPFWIKRSRQCQKQPFKTTILKPSGKWGCRPMPVILLKMYPITLVFLQILRSFSQHVFYKALPADCLCTITERKLNRIRPFL